MNSCKIQTREERLVYLLQKPQYRPACLALFRLGEAVNMKLLKLMKKKCPELITELCSVNFHVPTEYNYYTDEDVDMTRDVYNFFCRHCGHDKFQKKVLETPSLWSNFLNYLPVKNQSALEKKLQELVEMKRMYLAVQLISSSQYLQRSSVQKRLADEVREVVAWAKRYCAADGIAQIFDFEFLMEANWWNPYALKAYLGTPVCSNQHRLNKVLACKDGAEVLKRLKIPYASKKQRKPEADKKA